MRSKLIDELRRKYKSPQEALRKLGLDVSLIEPRLASDESDVDLRPLLLALEADNRAATIAADAHADSYSQRWPQASRISVEY